MQTTNHIFVVRPANFGYNQFTATTNSFQTAPSETSKTISQRALAEFDEFVGILETAGVDVTVFEENEEPVKTDSVFPNNWITTHADGRIILYPMHCPVRRTERRADIIEAFKANFEVKEVIDLSIFEDRNEFLEGTGSMILDREHKIAYACISPRTSKVLFEEACAILGYKPVGFYSLDEQGIEIYHTNVMMCLGEKFCVICLESISNEVERKAVESSLENTGHEIVAITREQIKQFAGNMLELKSKNGGNILAMSAAAFQSLNDTQKQQLEQYVSLVPLPVQTIESVGGGSVRCMIAENFLPEKLSVVHDL